MTVNHGDTTRGTGRGTSRGTGPSPALAARRARPGRVRAGVWRSLAVAAVLAGAATGSGAADFTARQVTELLFQSGETVVNRLSGRDLSQLDLSGLDFKSARLAGSNLYGVDLTRSTLKGSDLSGSKLDRAVITGADFSHANLAGASLQRPTVFSDMRFDRTEAPIFAHANLTGARVFARLDGADFRGANLTAADLSPYDRRGGDVTVLPQVVLIKSNFSGANLANANLGWTKLQFANLGGANLRGAVLAHSDLTQADLREADLTGADLAGADFYGADLRGVRGLAEAKGLDAAINMEKAIR